MLLTDHGKASKVTLGDLVSPFIESAPAPYNRLWVPLCGPVPVPPCHHIVGENPAEQMGSEPEPAAGGV